MFANALHGFRGLAIGLDLNSVKNHLLDTTGFKWTLDHFKEMAGSIQHIILTCFKPLQLDIPNFMFMYMGGLRTV